MKRPFSLTLFLSFSAVSAPAVFVPAVFAQVAPVSKTASSTALQRDPRAVALVEQSLSAYRKLNGLRLTTRLEMVNDKGQPMTQNEEFEWQRPYFARWRITDNNGLSRISDGSVTYLHPEAKREAVRSPARYGVPLADHFSRLLLVGQNPLLRFNVVSSTAKLSRTPRATKAGALCNGVQIETRPQVGTRDLLRIQTLWFDSQTHLLRAIEQRTEGNIDGKRLSMTQNYYFDKVELNPGFVPDHFRLPMAPKTQNPPPAAIAEAQETFWDKNLAVGQVAPRVEGVDVKGQKISLSVMKGQVVVVDFWATWCGPCAQELLAVEKLRSKLKSPAFKVIGVSLDADKAAVLQFVREEKMLAPQLCDGQAEEGANAKRYGLKAVPFKIVVGKNGTIAAVNPSARALERIVRAELKK